MTAGNLKDQGLAKVLEKLCAIDVVEYETVSGARSVLTIEGDSDRVELEITVAPGDYRDRKIQYERLRDALTALGIEEGAIYTPPPPSRRGMTPQIRAARDCQKRVFEAWQETWRELRRAEKALDVEYEIAQMKDYY